MSKLSKKFRQLSAIKYLILLRSKLFNKFSGYKNYRQNILKLKWELKFFFYPRYRRIKKHILKHYQNIKIFRPESTFSEFDLALTAREINSKNLVFIQIITKEHFKSRGEDFFQTKIDSFLSKQRCYEKFFNELNKVDKAAAEILVKIKAHFTSNKYAFFVSDFRDFIPMFKMNGGVWCFLNYKR